MKLRPATIEDAGLLLGWANDPAVRAASFNTAPIQSDEHHRWLRDKLAGHRCAFYIAELGGKPVGYARVDMYGRYGELSVSIAASHRGQGYGRALIAAAAERALAELEIDEVRAHIKAGNGGSLAAFLAAGFQPHGQIELAWQPR